MDEDVAAERIPAPSSDLAEPNVVDVALGRVLHRVHRRRFAGNAFNPCEGSPTRFAPIAARSGECVPSLYAGGTVAAAIYETVLHDVPVAAKLKSVPVGLVRQRLHSTLVVRRALRLVSLREPDLKKWSIDRRTLIGSLPTRYAGTARWAQAIHSQFPDVDGLVWTSNQCDPDDAVLFFADRMTPTDLEVVSVRDGLSDGSFLDDVREAGARAGIRITL